MVKNNGINDDEEIKKKKANSIISNKLTMVEIKIHDSSIINQISEVKH